uniref:Uncharacterized protein n=1 Tax=Plectus sambesii TaxID=2011161 RepID=A0A914WER2_9BILA
MRRRRVQMHNRINLCASIPSPPHPHASPAKGDRYGPWLLWLHVAGRPLWRPGHVRNITNAADTVATAAAARIVEGLRRRAVSDRRVWSPLLPRLANTRRALYSAANAQPIAYTDAYDACCQFVRSLYYCCQVGIIVRYGKMSNYAYMDGNEMYPDMFIHMKVNIITDGHHNGMILHQSVSTGPDGALHIHTAPEFPQDWSKRGYPGTNNAIRPPPNMDPSRMIGWNDQGTQADEDKEKRRKHRRKHRHDSEKRHRRRMADDADAVSNGSFSEPQPEALAADLDSTPEFIPADDSDTRVRREGRTFPGAVPVFPMNGRYMPAPRRQQREEPEYEEELQSTSDPFVLPDRVRLNVFEEVEPARFADADIKRMESNKRPIIQYPVDTEQETDAEQSASNATGPSDNRLSQRSERRPMYNVIPVETVTDTVTTTTTIEVFRTTNDPNNPTDQLILPPPPVLGGAQLPPQILRADGPAHELFTHTTTETLVNDVALQPPRPAMRRIDQKRIQQPNSSTNSQSNIGQPLQTRRLVKETLIDDPGIPLRTSNDQHYSHSTMPYNDQQRAKFPTERQTFSPPSPGRQSTLTSMPKQTADPLAHPAHLLPTTAPIRLRPDFRNEQSESFSSHSSLASINRRPPFASFDRSPKTQLSMAPMTFADFPSDLPDLPPEISPRHVVRVESLSSLSDHLPPPSPPPPMSRVQQEEQFEHKLPDQSNEREVMGPVDQMFSFDRTQVRVTSAKNRPVFRPPPIPTQIQLQPAHAPQSTTSEGIGFHSDETNYTFPPAPSPLDFSRDHHTAPSGRIHDIYTAKKSPTASPHNSSFDRPPTKASSSSHNSSIDEERSGLSSHAPQSTIREEQTTTTIFNQREIYTIEETRTSNEIPTSSSDDLNSDRRLTASSFGKPDSQQSTLIKNSVIKHNIGGHSSSPSSIDSERSSVSGMMRSKGVTLGRPDMGSEGENLSDYLQSRMTPLGQDLNGLYYVDDSVKSQDSVISEASNRADRSHDYYERHRHEEQILSPPPEPRSFAEMMQMSVSPPPPPAREVRFNPIPSVRRSSSSSNVSLSSMVSAQACQEETSRFAQVLSREPMRYDIQPAYGEARTEPVSVLADRMRQMLEREEESLRLRSTVNSHI